MAKFDHDHLRATYAAVSVFRERGLAELDSLFTPGVPVWTANAIDDIYRRFVENPDESGDSFLVKLERQLDGAPDRTIQLMGELFYVHLLAPVKITGGTKRRNIETVLSWAEQPVKVPGDLASGLDEGFMSTGMAFGTGRPLQLRYLFDFVRSWIAITSTRRSALLEDAWAFKDFVYEIDCEVGAAQKNALLYLVHPDTFEDIVAGSHKEGIVKAFAERATGEDDIDRALLSIRTSLEKESGGRIGFYEPEWASLWREEPAPAKPAETVDAELAAVENHAWLVRAGKRNESLIDGWLSDGYCAIGWRNAGEIEPGTSDSEIKRKVRGAWADQSDGWIRAAAGNIHRFVNQILIGDLVVVPVGDDIYVGAITSDPYWSDVGQPTRRSVEWKTPSAPIERSTLSESAYSKMRTLLTVTDMSADYDEFAAYAGLVDKPQPKASLLPAIDVDLADALYLPQEWLNEVIGLLREKRQVVFYGPPGTGKTYVAQELADYLTGGEGATLVQFHPSYTYEDFFEGYRPQGGPEGSVGFELTQGPLRRVADAAAEDPTKPYVLIIDEINRANLAKVFGELYYLLEYRDRSVALLYGTENEFTLPKNLYIIGTMNTADRSIAFVDTAMRRRFYFVPFFPTQEPVSSVLAKWLANNSLGTEAAKLLELLNARIDDDDFAVGPSYFMSARVDDDGFLNRVWQHAITPLLEEHFFGRDRNVHKEFGLEALRKALTPPDDPKPGDAVDGSPA